MFLNIFTKGKLLNTIIVLFISLHGLSQSQQLIQYTTTADKRLLFHKSIIGPINSPSAKISNTIIKVNPAKHFQKMEGYGYAFTGGTAKLIHELPALQQDALLREIFGNEIAALQVSYIRVSMGASDLDEAVFSYCDLPKGETDAALAHFTLSYDTLHLIPLLKKAIGIQPHLKIIASPWSAPSWMKTNGASMGGHLDQKYYGVYAQYFVKYIKSMQANGIRISGVTIQNEPEHGGNNPSMLMDAMEQTVFVRDYLGPAFKAANISTEIVIWDHNADHPNYPITVLNDAKAKSFIAAAAFHMYLGDELALKQLHDQHPDKKIYFTEQWTGAKGDFDGDFMWHLEHIVIGTINNWSSMVLEWNLAADANYAPHTPGGCTECKGAFTIQNNQITKNVSYYIIGQIAKYVPAGSIRIGVEINDPSIKTTAFVLPNGKHALLALNTDKEKEITIMMGTKKYAIHLPTKSAATLIW
jgi:glucosylceramidase